MVLNLIYSFILLQMKQLNSLMVNHDIDFESMILKFNRKSR